MVSAVGQAIDVCRYCGSPQHDKFVMDDRQHDYMVCRSCRANSDDLLVSVARDALTTAQRHALIGSPFDSKAHEAELGATPADIGAYLDWIEKTHPSELDAELAKLDGAIARERDSNGRA